MEFQNVVYLLFWAALFVVMMRFGCGAHVMGQGHQHGGAGSDDGRWAPPAKATDPVCGMTVETAGAKSAIHDGHVYYFCSQDCRAKFEANPAAYAKPMDATSRPQEGHHHGCC